jgi:hypothetical protein
VARSGPKSFTQASFEGYSGMLIFFTLMPIGAILGGLLGAIGIGHFASRDRANTL